MTAILDLPVSTEITPDKYKQWLRRQYRLTPLVKEAIERADQVCKKWKAVCYIAGALTEASEEDKERYARVSKIAQAYDIFGYAPHLFGTDPKKHPNVTPQEVRDIDFLWAVVMADFHINFLSPVAHGNAIEEGWGEDAYRPTIYCAPNGARISRLPHGMLNLDHLITYGDIEGAYQALERFFNELSEWQREHSSSGSKLSEFFIERKLVRKEIFHPILTAMQEIECSKDLSEVPTVDRIIEKLWENGVQLDVDQVAEILDDLLCERLIYLAGIEMEGEVWAPYFFRVSEFGCPSWEQRTAASLKQS